MPQSPSFDEWVHYCFTLGYADFNGSSSDSDEVVDARRDRFCNMDRQLLTSHLIRLFESPAFLVGHYTSDQIADATWFIFGVGSEFFHALRSESVPADLQVRAYLAMKTMYTDLFDRICGRGVSQPDDELEDAIDTAVYMIWDMGTVDSPVSFPEGHPHLVEPSLEVLHHALLTCRTLACRESALHGLGHTIMMHDRGKHIVIAESCRGMIDEFLSLPDLPRHLREYAAAAREGLIQ